MNNPTFLTRLMRRGLLIAGAWLLAGCVSAPPTQAPPASDCPPTAAVPTPEEVRVGMRDARDRGFMWRITRGDHSSYLYGTIHVARREWLFPGPAVASASRESDSIALEIDPLAPGVANSLVEGKREGQRGLTLPDSLLERLQRRIAAECLAPERMAKMGPEAQIAALNVLANRRDGLDPTYATEIMLSGLGRNANKTVFALKLPKRGCGRSGRQCRTNESHGLKAHSRSLKQEGFVWPRTASQPYGPQAITLGSSARSNQCEQRPPGSSS